MTPGGQEYERFLAQFDGDVERAIAALRQYANTHAPKAPATPVRPTRPSHPATGPIIMSMQHVHKTYKLGRQSITALDDVTSIFTKASSWHSLVRAAPGKAHFCNSWAA